MTRPPPPAKGRIGLREIAAAAGVCPMTVSLSLRDSPKISAATRERIRRLAAQLGYRPDPELSRLMKHLRGSRTARDRSALAIVDFNPTVAHAEHVYIRSIREGATRRAAELGFGVTPFHGAEYPPNLRGMLNVVRNRGIDGLVLLPSLVPITLEPTLSWDGLSVVATSNSIVAPRFHYVVPNQFGNTMRLIESVQARGLRRICAVFDELFDERTAHNFTAAFKWNAHDRMMLVVPLALPPAQKCARIARWIAKQRPDVVFAQCDAVAPAIRSLRESHPRLAFEIIGLGAHNSAGHSYLDERPDLVGAAAVELLAGMIYYHETGIPAHPRTTMIDGELRPEQLAARLACPAAAVAG